MRKQRMWVIVCLAALALLWGSFAGAQTFRGTILGTVTDASGAAIGGAKVTVKDVATGLTRTVTTSDDGSYSVPELPIGTYTVTVGMAGFKSAVLSGVVVEVAVERRADVTLQPGEVAEKVEVSASELPEVQSTSDVLGGVVESTVVANLPVNGGDYQKLIFLVPGVTGSPDQITDSPGSFGIFSLNGARGRANNFLLDGTDMNDGYRNDPAINEAGVFGTPATLLPVEAIAEMHVESNFEAEYGRSAGAVVNIVTKSGTNTLHGSANEFFRNNALDARNYFNQVGQEQNPFHNNQFGASLGGPIVKDRTFFFLDYEGVREKGAEASTACVPTQQDITDNTPSGGINPVIANLLAKSPWPKPNLAGSCIGNSVEPQVPDNISLATPFSNRVDSGIVKIDHSFNQNNMLTGRYYIGDSDQSFPLALVGGGLVPGYNTATPTRVQLISLSFVSTITPAIVNEARLGWNRFAEGFFPQDRGFDPSTIGLNTGVTSYDFGLPKISVGGFAPIGADNGDPRQRVDTNWHYIDNVSWKHGKHDIKFGYEFRRTSVSQIFNRGFRGKLGFNTLRSFLLGTPNPSIFSSTQASGNTDRNTFENSYAAYFQDGLHLTRSVMLNLGIRYDYFGVINEKKGLFTNVNQTNGTGFLVGSGQLYKPDYKNWSPRVSVAWDVAGKGKTVVRAGYGIFYDAFSQDMFMGHLPFNSIFDPGPAYSGFQPGAAISFGTVATDSSGNALPLSVGAPVFPNIAPMSDAFGVDQHIRTPYMQNFNLNFQQDLGHQMAFEIGYVGSNGHKLFRFRDINQPNQATITACDLGTLPACAGAPTIHDGSVPRVFAATSPFFYINYEESSANSNYNALQVSYRVNGWHGVTSTFNYTWSHSIDDASDGEDYVPNAAQPNDSTAPIKFNRGNSNFDVRNRLTWNFIYQFPNSSGSWQKLKNGWGLNGIVTVQSGQPFHLNYNFEDDYDGSGEFFGRPDVVGPIVYHPRDPNNYLDLSAFAVPCTYPASGGDGFADTCIPGTRHFGNEGRNSLIGPNFRQVDFSIFKNTNLTERLKMELRFEAYNVFNHPNFSNPYLPIFIADAAQHGVGSNGHSLNAVGANGQPEGFQLTATGDVGIGYPFLGSGGPRGIQLAAKFTF